MLALYSMDELKNRIERCISVFIFGTGNRLCLLSKRFKLDDFEDKIKDQLNADFINKIGTVKIPEKMLCAKGIKTMVIHVTNILIQYIILMVRGLMI